MPTKNIAQLTLNPAPKGTDLLETDDGAGNSWRSSFDDLALPPFLGLTFAGTLPASFPSFQIAGILGLARPAGSGNTQIVKCPGVSTFTPFVADDPLGLLTSLSFDNLGAFVGGAIRGASLIGCEFAPANFPNLTSLSAPVLIYIGGDFNPGTMAALTTLAFPSLTYIQGVFQPAAMASLTTLSFPALQFVGSNFFPTTLNGVTSADFSALKYIGGNFNPGSMNGLATMLFPALTHCTGNFDPTNMSALTTFSAPVMVFYGGIIGFFTGLGNLTTLTLGTPGVLKKITGATINISGQKLNQASVNGILALLVSLDGTGGTTLWGAGKTVNLSGGTSASPSGQGIIDKATLIARTATVTTN
jgi:hypothetical protein